MKKKTPVSEFLSLVEVDDYKDTYKKDITDEAYFGLPLKPIIDSEKRLKDKSAIAYFSMEYGLASSFYNAFKASRSIHPNNKIQEHEVFSNFRLADYFFTFHIDNILDIPLYSGGLGVLAGDTIKTLADQKIPAVAVGMLWNTGYFRQRFWFKYGQMPEAIHWDPVSYPGLIPLKNKIKISLKSDDIHLRLWKYYVYNFKRDFALPLLLLDSRLESNRPDIRHLTDQLYRSDNAWIRIMQRAILGIGGVAALKELGCDINIHHLNEGHAIFAFLGKMRENPKNRPEELKKHFVYTCHTPVAAGHDRFGIEDIKNVFDDKDAALIESLGKENENTINLTLFSLNASSRINAVSKSHQKVMHLQFPQYKDAIQSVTNGIHVPTWISQSFAGLFKDFASSFGDIKTRPEGLKKAHKLKGDKRFRKALWQAHQANKSNLCDFLQKWRLNKDVFTICWARRVAAYKRPSMILKDVDRLMKITEKYGPVQIIFAGKAHPMDNLGFTYINEMLDKVDGLNEKYDNLKIIMLENYEIFLARLLTSSIDVWLNNPLPPFEASGTSGMKAILNGVIQVTTLDGWVAEAENAGIGKIFGYRNKENQAGNEMELRIEEDAKELYDVMEEIVPLYYKTNDRGEVDLSSPWIDMMINCVATAADFNTAKMLDNYKSKIWGFKERG